MGRWFVENDGRWIVRYLVMGVGDCANPTNIINTMGYLSSHSSI